MAVPHWTAGLMWMVRRLNEPIRIGPFLTGVGFLDLQAWQRRRHAARQGALARRDRAIQSSRELLRACLRAEQLRQFDRAGWFSLPEAEVKLLQGQRPMLSDLAKRLGIG